MRRLVLPFLLLLALVAFGAAQSNEATSAPATQSRPVAGKAQKPATESLLNRAMTWARKSAHAMSKGGRSYAEGVIRKTPKAFTGMKTEIQGFAKRVAQNGGLKDLDEKRRYVAELWRLRASLDLMALLDARTLQTITGIDAKLFESLQRTLASAAKSLGLAPAQTRPATKAAARG